MDGCREVGVEHQTTKITEPDADDDEDGDPDWSDRRTQREIAQLVTGGEGSHSRTDPDLVGLDRATWAGRPKWPLHVAKPPPADTTDQAYGCLACGSVSRAG